MVGGWVCVVLSYFHGRRLLVFFFFFFLFFIAFFFIFFLGGLFTYVTAANYFSEMIEWTGFAIACWNISSVVFLVWTISNLSPRAPFHHKWYLNKFKEEYPKDRKILFPFIW